MKWKLKDLFFKNGNLSTIILSIYHICNVDKRLHEIHDIKFLLKNVPPLKGNKFYGIVNVILAYQSKIRGCDFRFKELSKSKLYYYVCGGGMEDHGEFINYWTN